MDRIYDPAGMGGCGGCGSPYLVIFDEEVAVFEQSAATDLFRIPGGDHLAMEVRVRLAEVAVHRLSDHGRVEVLADGHVGAVVKQKQRVEDNLERVDREFELAPHRVHKLQLDVLAAVVTQRDQ